MIKSIDVFWIDGTSTNMRCREVMIKSDALWLYDTEGNSKAIVMLENAKWVDINRTP